LSGSGLCDELITRPEKSYRLWCVVVCDLYNLVNEAAMTRVGSQRHKKKNIYNTIILCDHRHICGPSLIETSLCDAYL
jgi:hypothetical protein